MLIFVTRRWRVNVIFNHISVHHKLERFCTGVIIRANEVSGNSSAGMGAYSSNRTEVNVTWTLLNLCILNVRDVITQSNCGKWNKMNGILGHLCAHVYRLNLAKRTFWVWSDDTSLQTQYSKFEPWRSEAELATTRSRWLPIILHL